MVGLIEERLADERTVLVVAPSGCGKTSAVGEWAEGHRGRVAWLTLGPFDTTPTRLGRSVLQAFQALARSQGGDDLDGFLDFDLGDIDPAIAFDLVAEAMLGAESTVHLVIDDAHRAQDQLAEALLGALIEGGCERLKVAIVGRSYVEIALSRFVLYHPGLVIRAQDLAFDLDEISRLPGASSPGLTPETILEETRGWPIAIRFVQMTGVAPDPEDRPDETLIRDYVNRHLLSAVPTEIRDFALATSVCDGMSAGLASAAASFSERDEPLRTADYWLQAGNPERAVETLLSRWESLVVGHDSDALDRWCASLPRPFDDDPRVLLVRACAQDVGGAAEVARAVRAARPIRPGLPTLLIADSSQTSSASSTSAFTTGAGIRVLSST